MEDNTENVHNNTADVEIDETIGGEHELARGKITLPRSLYQKMKGDLFDAEVKAAGLQKDLDDERGRTVDNKMAVAFDLIDAFKVIADHHCANLSPEFIADMPVNEIETASALVVAVGRVSERDRERAGVWMERAQLIRDWDKRRATPEWQARVAEYKAKKLREDAEAAGFKLVPLKATKPATKRKPAAKRKPVKRKGNGTGRKGQARRRSK